MLPNPTISRKLLTNEAYGFPRGEPRRVEPIALLCLHVTDNPSNPPATAIEERNFANRPNSKGPSAHYYVDRDGSAILAILPSKYAAWSNGDVRSPRTDIPGIPAVLKFAERYNANEAYVLEVETVGRYPDYAHTHRQIETVALLVAQASLATDLPIERSTVHLHSDLNTETRNACPAPREKAIKLVEEVIRLAGLYRVIMAQNVEIENLTESLAQSEAARADALATIIRWEEYGEEVTSRAGGILGLDRPK